MTRASSRGSRLRPIVAVLAALVAIAALSWWAGRDLPRRWLEGRLGRALDAEVRLSRLEIESPRHFVLHGLEVRRPGWEPRLESVAIERLDVVSPIAELLRERYGTLTADGVDVRVVPPTRPAEPLPQSAILVRRIDVRRGRMLAVVDDRETRTEFTATLRDWGAEPTGELRLAAAQLDAAVLAGVFGNAGADLTGTADALEARAELVRDPPGVRLHASAARIRAGYGERTFDVPEPRVEGTVVLDRSMPTLLLSAEVFVPGIESARLEAELDRDSKTLLNGRGELRGVEIGTLVEAGLTLPEGWILEGSAHAAVHTDDGERLVYAVGAELDRIEIAIDRGSLRGRGLRAGARGNWRLSPAEAEPRLEFELDAAVASVNLVSGAIEVDAGQSKLAASGRVDPASGGRLVARLDLPRGGGRFEGLAIPAELFPVEARTDGRLTLEPSARWNGTTELVSRGLGSLRIDGHSELPSSGPRASWKWDWSAAPDLATLSRVAEQMGLATLPETVVLHGRPRASGTVEGPLRDPAVHGRLFVDLLSVASSGLELADGHGSAGFRRGAVDGGRVVFDEVEVGGDLGQDSPAWSRPAKLVARGRADLEQGTARLDDGRLEMEGLGRLTAEAERFADASVVARLTLEPVELAALREMCRLWIDDAYPEHTLKGTVSSRVEARLATGGGWQAEGSLRVDGAGFSSPDGSRVIEGAGGVWQVRLAVGDSGSLEGSAAGVLDGPVMLWGTLFGDFSSLSSELDLSVRSDGDGWESEIEWSLPQDVRIGGRLAGETGHRGTRYALTTDVPDLSAFLEHYIRLPFEGSVENIDTLEASGGLHVDLAGSAGDERRTVHGTVTATGASFRGAEGGTTVGGLDLALPLALEWRTRPDGGRELAATGERAGSLSWDRLLLAGVEFPALQTRLSVIADTIRLDRPLRLAVLDGNMSLSRVALADWSSPSRHLEFGMGLDGLSLEALTASLGTFPLQGTLDASFPAVRLTPDRLVVDGGGTIRIFGGNVEVYDISGRDVLSRFPRFRFSASFEDLRLLDVTRRFDFGEVYGVARGEIRDCELFRGVPVRCEAEVHTVETKGVPRKISVKAVRNISILGSGSRVGVFDRGLQKFFDTYTYSRIGITMRLRNDRFVLRGTERRGDRELFVKGRLPFRIDIVNVAPGQAVSFQTMLSRLQNLEMGTGPAREKR